MFNRVVVGVGGAEGGRDPIALQAADAPGPCPACRRRDPDQGSQMAIKIPLSPLEEEEGHSLTQLAADRATLCARSASARKNAL